MKFQWPLSLSPSTSKKASRAGFLTSLQVMGRAVWTPRDYENLAKESYAKNAVAFRAIAEISKCGSSVPFQLFKGTGSKKREVETHALLDLLKRPNPLQSQQQFLSTLIGFFLVAGNSYMEAVGPATRAPMELWIKRPDRMKIIAGPKGIPSAFELSLGGESVRWTVNMLTGISLILHWKSFNPLNDWYGQSPVEAAAFAIDQHNEAGKWNMSLLQNSARPSGALVVDPKLGTGLDDDQYQRLLAQIDDKYAGSTNSGRPMLLEGGLDWKEMGLSPTDMDWMNGKHTAAREIAMVFGMPAQMLGIPGDNTHRNMEEARLWLWEQTIMPLLEGLLGELNWWLTPRFGEDLMLKFDYDQVPALISRRHTLWDKVSKSDFLTIDEKRAATGFEPLPNGKGDVVLVPVNKQPVDSALAVGEGEDSDKDDDSDDDEKTTKKTLQAVV